MKTRLEISWNNDGTAFLNYWDVMNGRDVCCLVDKGKLFEAGESGSGNKEISLAEFLERVKESAGVSNAPAVT